MAPIPTPVVFSTPSEPVKKARSLPPHVTRDPSKIPQGPTRRFRKSKAKKARAKLSKRAEEAGAEQDDQHEKVSQDELLDIDSGVEPGAEENYQHPTVSLEDILEMYQIKEKSLDRRRETKDRDRDSTSTESSKSRRNQKRDTRTSVSSSDLDDPANRYVKGNNDKAMRDYISDQNLSVSSHRPSPREIPEVKNQKRAEEQGRQLGHQQIQEREVSELVERSADPPLSPSESYALNRQVYGQQQHESYSVPSPPSGPSDFPAPISSSYPWLHLAGYSHEMKSYVSGAAGIIAAALLIACVSWVLLRRRYQKLREQRGRFGVDASAGHRRRAGRGGCFGCCGGRRKQNELYGGKGFTELENDEEALEAEAFSMRPESPVGAGVGAKGDSTVETVGKWDDGMGVDKKMG
ncbi:MAG: hypothetical protein M1831_005437 [Alyxoria varia]|nr:MAG: hypothetical protein M1831_005437 [Alyxoria varia]